MALEEIAHAQARRRTIPALEGSGLLPSSRPAQRLHVLPLGLRGVGKDRTKLETAKIGGRRYTSHAALARFVARLTGEAEVREQLTRQRTESFLNADKEMRRDGL